MIPSHCKESDPKSPQRSPESQRTPEQCDYGFTRRVLRHLIGDCQYCHLRITSFDQAPESKGFVPGELILIIGCIGADSIDNPQLNDGKTARVTLALIPKVRQIHSWKTLNVIKCPGKMAKCRCCFSNIQRLFSFFFLVNLAIKMTNLAVKAIFVFYRQKEAAGHTKNPPRSGFWTADRQLSTADIGGQFYFQIDGMQMDKLGQMYGWIDKQMRQMDGLIDRLGR